MAELRVATAVYTGPLDLLLYLCRRAEVDIYDLPVAEIAEQYIHELEAMKVLDLEYAGEFLTMAASLLKLKSDLVVARSEEQAAAQEERSRLVRQLLEYKRIRDLAYLLEQHWGTQVQRYPRPTGLLGSDTPESSNDTYIEDVTVVDLFRVYQRLHGEVAAPKAHLVELEGKPVRYYVELILEQLQRHGKVDFSQLFAGKKTRSDVIGNFLALLEMVKQREISIEQKDNGDIVIGPPQAYDDAPPPAPQPGA